MFSLIAKELANKEGSLIKLQVIDKKRKHKTYQSLLQICEKTHMNLNDLDGMPNLELKSIPPGVRQCGVKLSSS